MLNETNASHKLSYESRTILWLDFGFSISIQLSGIFLSIFLWRLSESWAVNGIYHIALFIFVVIGFILGGWISKRLGQIFTVRLGIFTMAFFFLTLLVFQEKVVEFPYLFGMLNGLAQGFYWIAMLVLAYNVTTNQNRLRFFGWQTAAIALAGILGPFIAGFIIDSFPDLTGYIIVFGLSLGLFILIIIGSFFVQQEKVRSRAFLLPYIIKRNLKRSKWKKHFFGWFIMGLREGITLLIPPVLLYDIVQKESIVGLLIVLFGVVNIVSSQLLGRFGLEKHYHYHIFGAAAGLTITALLLIYQVNFMTVVIFMIGNAFFSPAIRMVYTSYMYRLMSDLPNSGKKLKAELIATRQIFLTIGRILTVVLFMMYVDGMDYKLMAWVLTVASITQFILYFVMVDKKEVRPSFGTSA